MTARDSAARSRLDADWGDRRARELDDDVLAGARIDWAGAVVLDLGCDWGYLLKHLLEHRAIRAGHGVDVEAHWTRSADCDPRSVPGLHLHQGRLGALPELEGVRFDVALTTDTTHLMRPTELHRALAWIHDHLLPGGTLVLETRTYLGATASPEAAGRYVSPSSAATYLAQLDRAGFQLVAARRRAGDVDAPAVPRFADEPAVDDAEELRSTALTAYARRPRRDDAPAT